MFKKLIEAFYEELNIQLILVPKRLKDDTGWGKEPEVFDSMLKCLNSINALIEPLGGVSKFESYDSTAMDLFSSMHVSFKIPKKTMALAKSNVVSFFNAKGLAYSDFGRDNWFTIHF